MQLPREYELFHLLSLESANGTGNATEMELVGFSEGGQGH